jgi:Fe2+ transport system protein FeoA
MKHIQQLQVGDRAKVVRLSKANPVYRQKLLAMGLTPGTQFLVKRIAPLGDPIELHVRGYGLSLRKKEAQVLEIERV